MANATLTILEYARVGDQGPDAVPVASLTHYLTRQDVVAVITGAAVQSAALNARTRYIEVFTDTNGFIAYGSDPTAVAATGIPVKTGSIVGKGFHVEPGKKLSFISP